MAESFVQVTEGSGKKLHTFQRAVGANTVEDSIVLPGLPYLPTYSASVTSAVSLATADTHILQVMAGSTLNVYVTRIRIYLASLAGTLSGGAVDIKRLSTAGTGGTALNVLAHDTADVAAGATAQTAPTVKGTVGSIMRRLICVYPSAWPTSGGETALIADLKFGDDVAKAIRIPAGTANGLAIVQATAIANASVYVNVEFVESGI